MDEVTVVVPAYNEASRIGPTVQELVPEYTVLVIDDGSTDGTASEARQAGARVVQQPINKGYICALKRGFREASGDVIVTYDGDGEHRPRDNDQLVEPVILDQFDLVLGARTSVPRRTERFLNSVVQLNVGVSDAYTGFRALRRSLAQDLELETPANCGTLVLEAAEKNARIGELEIRTRQIQKPRGIALDHGRHFIDILRFLIEA